MSERNKRRPESGREAGRRIGGESQEEARRRRAHARRAEEKRRRQRRRRIVGIVLAVLAAAVLISALVGGGSWAVRKAKRLFKAFPTAVVERYPLEYADLIRTYAAENGLEPAYVAAVILAESSYNPEAVSAVGARGLMQLMEETAADVAGWLGEDFNWDAMFDPETNIRYGCCLLGRLMRRYDGDMRCASSAYHQGPGKVDEWLRNPEYSEDGKTLAVIASEVTDSYVNKILRYYDKYAELYAEGQI